MKGMTKGFCIDTTEVTQAQYSTWLSSNPSTADQITECTWNSTFMPDVDCSNNMMNCRTNCENHAQNCVDWCDAYAFCKSVGKRLCGRIGGGTNQFDSPQYGSQWHEVCSSGNAYRFTYGADFDDTKCNGIENGIQGTIVVGSKKGCQSPVAAYAGVFDLIADVAEWEDSCSGSGQTAICRARGASFSAWGEDTENCAYDQSSTRDTTLINLGFRCCAP